MKKAAFSLLSMLLALLGVSVAYADETRCFDTLPPGTYDKVIVPAGSNCTVTLLSVQSDFFIENGALLVVVSDSTIGGNLQGEGFVSLKSRTNSISGNLQAKKARMEVEVCDTTIGGNLQVEEQIGGSLYLGGIPVPEPPACPGNILGGNLQTTKNIAWTTIDNNIVGGNLQHVENRRPSSISGNTISGHLQCEKNVPPPTGSGNTAAKKQGQCRTF